MKKKFDCVEMARNIKRKQEKEIRRVGLEGWLKRVRERLAKDPLWQRFEKKAVAR